MLRPTFIVFEADGGWRIRHDGRHYGPYPTERSAILAAIDAADRSPKSGHNPRVRVQARLSGKLYAEWEYGDPYPADFEYYRASLMEVRAGPNSRKWFVA